MTREQQKEWRKIRAAVLDRDMFMCQRCEKKSGNGKLLTVHHVIPRDEGGSMDLSNLITLCEKCHDAVEIAGYRLLAEICSTDNDPVKELDREPPLDYYYVEGFTRPSWHKYVYGGQKRP